MPNVLDPAWRMDYGHSMTIYQLTDHSLSWEIPSGPFDTALGQRDDNSRIKCPAPGCSEKYYDEEEYKRHIGEQHLRPYSCVNCAHICEHCSEYILPSWSCMPSKKYGRFYVGRKVEIYRHVRDVHRIERPAEGEHYEAASSEELEQRSRDIFTEPMDPMETLRMLDGMFAVRGVSKHGWGWNMVNGVKLFVESWVHSPVSFWPLQQPRQQVLKGETRFYWDCNCGLEISIDVPNSIAEEYTLNTLSKPGACPTQQKHDARHNASVFFIGDHSASVKHMTNVEIPLSQPDSESLFAGLVNTYTATRNYRRFLSWTMLSDLRYVHFKKRTRISRFDQYKNWDILGEAVPPQGFIDYRTPCAPLLAGAELLSHFKSPKCDSGYLQEFMPRRLLGPRPKTEKEGYGLQAIEGVSFFKVLAAGVVVYSCAGALVAFWAKNRPAYFIHQLAAGLLAPPILICACMLVPDLGEVAYYISRL